MPNTSYLRAWVPENAPIPALMVVPLPLGPEKLDMRRYLDLMSLRLSDLLDAQEDPEAAAEQTAREFEQVGLAPADVRTHSSLAAAMDLIEDNLMFRTWLTLTDAMLEPVMAEPSAEALELLQETDLETYLEHLPAMSEM